MPALAPPALPIRAPYIRLYDGETLISFTHFSLVEAGDVTGDLIDNDPHGENIWMEDHDLVSKEMIPSMKDIAEGLNKPGTFFLDKKYRV